MTTATDDFDSIPQPAAQSTPLSDLLEGVLQGKLVCKHHLSLKDSDAVVYILEMKPNKASTVELFPPSVVGVILYIEGGTISFSAYETPEELWGDWEDHLQDSRG